ncbi:uncharacterized protein F4807DRAFT_462710 [Annulohypoxylon truncatum]|uniref:uncharacterized protein n=1 Tax=Annulohypoxylon truncatum TaxID=327061 RepID=UPI00200838F9|nr:uncharacterized protein F4807DRAFT_462710 [Annulohypoxylon truncatum]KAI1207557.1 hypothetical protein F4807DRAFT_462710 [Annulohypoxylon truncatum]
MSPGKKNGGKRGEQEGDGRPDREVLRPRGRGGQSFGSRGRGGQPAGQQSRGGPPLDQRGSGGQPASARAGLLAQRPLPSQYPGFLHRTFLQGSELEGQLIPTWKEQNGGMIPATVVTMQKISARTLLAWRTPFGSAADVKEMGVVADVPDEEPPPAPPTLPRPQRKRRNPRRRRKPKGARTSGNAEDVPMEGAETREVPGPSSPGPNLDFANSSLNAPPRRTAAELRALSLGYLGERKTCGNCQKPGHELSQCPGPVDADGFISGCPRHNTKEHSFDSCFEGEDEAELYRALVLSRANVPPLRTKYSWPEIFAKYKIHFGVVGFPLTRGFSLQIPAEKIEAFDVWAPAQGQLGIDVRTSTIINVRENLDSLLESEKAPSDVAMEAGEETEVKAEL